MKTFNFAEAKGIKVVGKVFYAGDFFDTGYNCKLETEDNYYNDEIFTLRILNDNYPFGFQNKGQTLSIVASKTGYERGSSEGILLFKGNYNDCKKFIRKACKGE